MKKYLFTSPRLGFRAWTAEDLQSMAELNADPEVMKWFPRTLRKEESKALMHRLHEHYCNRGYTYFPVDALDSGDFIGFIGLYFQEYRAPFSPAVDVGWRLLPQAWGKGYATEGALQCLDFAFGPLQLERVVAVCPAAHRQSEAVMRRIGMQRQGTFKHPKLVAYPHLAPCVWYEKQSDSAARDFSFPDKAPEN